MNSLKILYVYKWAGTGGVERVILNRTRAFKDQGLPVSSDAYFVHDIGGLTKFRDSIREDGLEQHLKIVRAPDFAQYDLIFSIDTPEVLQYVLANQRLFLECHTSYPENRRYLPHLPSGLGGIIVPSASFGESILPEVPEALRKKVYTLRNFIPEPNSTKPQAKFLRKIPLAYIGRMDRLKNTGEILAIFEALRRALGDRFVLYLLGTVYQPEIDLSRLIQERHLADRVVHLPPIQFSRVTDFLHLIRNHDGIFLSASFGESFGLSAAEAIMSDVPVLLSRIPMHANLVGQDESFLYNQGDLEGAVAKVEGIVENYELARQKLAALKTSLRSERFIEDWQAFLQSVQVEG